MSEQYEIAAKKLENLRGFLNSAPSMFPPRTNILKHRLSSSESVCCVRWNGEFLISGADILRCIMFKFKAFGRDVLNRGKFEELIFSDLRSSKSSVRARLEEGKSELLEFLHKHGAIRTKKKQRVFYWSAVPHDELFLDSLERELRRAVVDNHDPESNKITIAVREPARSMSYDPLLKVAHQIPNIIAESDPTHLPVLCALFGYRPPASQRVLIKPSRVISSGSSGTISSQSQRQFSEACISTHSAVDRSTSAHISPAALHRALSQTFPAPRSATPYMDLPYSAIPRSSSSTIVYPFNGYELLNTRPVGQGRTGSLRSSDSWLTPPEAANIRRDVTLPHIFDILPAYAQFDLPPPSPAESQNASIHNAYSPPDRAFSEASSQAESDSMPTDEQP